MAKKVGTSTGGIEQSPRHRRKRARARRAEEAEWAAKSGPVILRMAGHEVYVKPEPLKSDIARARKLLLGEIGQAGDVDGSVRQGT